ncbi:MAG: outer membrane protein assembly factor BamD [Bacteroidetes bacterium]|nr:MAG: outer membrane protein assembly factor BamD [Bacteroidota bacterium]
MKRIKQLGFYLLILLVAISCKHSRLLKNPDIDTKYTAAVAYFNEKDYSRALQLFDQMMGAIRATDKAEDLYYYYAYCYYYQKDYTLASYYFKRFYTSFPNSKRAEECLFMSAYCNFLNSPVYSLDQTSTNDAIKELQLFMNIYPKSKRVPECNDLIDKLRAKLELKDYKIAKLYYRMGDYAAAIMVFHNILKDFPETVHREEILFLVIKSYAKYASLSVKEKQYERYTNTTVAFQDFYKEFPASKFAGEAKELNEKSRTQLQQMVDKNKDMVEKESKRVRFK